MHGVGVFYILVLSLTKQLFKMTKLEIIKNIEGRIESKEGEIKVLKQRKFKSRFHMYRIEDLNDELIELRGDLKWVKTQPAEKFN